MSPIFLTLLLLSASSAFADDAPFRCNYEGNQQEMNVCADRDYHAADNELNETYKTVMSLLPAAKQKSLRQQQRLWLKKRDPQCKLKAEVKESEGGSIWPLLFFGCLQAATERRTSELKQWQTKQ
jgi:uncharacterized protein YecT (DUF1311 family)